MIEKNEGYQTFSIFRERTINLSEKIHKLQDTDYDD